MVFVRNLQAGQFHVPNPQIEPLSDAPKFLSRILHGMVLSQRNSETPGGSGFKIELFRETFYSVEL
jgi:hypothetical protein